MILLASMMLSKILGEICKTIRTYAKIPKKADMTAPDRNRLHDMFKNLAVKIVLIQAMIIDTPKRGFITNQRPISLMVQAIQGIFMHFATKK